MIWTAAMVRKACLARPYRILQRVGVEGYTPESRRRWTELLTAQRLSWQYGDEHAAEILSRTDPATREDVGAWYALGRRNAA